MDKETRKEITELERKAEILKLEVNILNSKVKSLRRKFDTNFKQLTLPLFAENTYKNAENTVKL